MDVSVALFVTVSSAFTKFSNFTYRILCMYIREKDFIEHERKKGVYIGEKGKKILKNSLDETFQLQIARAKKFYFPFSSPVKIDVYP